MKELYHFNGETGEFVGKSPARKDPMDEGNYLIPANATDIAAPHKEGTAAVFTDGFWANVDDNRGEVYWLPSGEQVTISNLDHVKPDDALDEAPIPNPRSLMSCTSLQGKIALGAEEWAKVIAYRDEPETPFSVVVTINDSPIWNRLSTDISLIGWALDYTGPEMDELFINAMKINGGET